MNNRNKLMIILVVAIVAVISIGATLALSQSLTNVEVNSFMVKNPDAFKAQLYEPDFDNDQQADAKKLIQGSVIKKNPHIKNESEDGTTGWVAMRILVSISGQPATAAQLDDINKLLSLDFNLSADGWERDSKRTDGLLEASEVFYYNKMIAPGEITSELFTTVTVRTTATESLIKKVYSYGEFDLIISGIAVDSDSSATLTQELKDYMKAELSK